MQNDITTITGLITGREQTSHRSDQLAIGLGQAALTAWADTTLAKPAAGGALLEQRHLLAEAAHPETVAALHHLAHTARIS
ncbi:hypothetical protein ACFYNO_32980 [Kitasatospora sp. NPDC006697]|uniref:hypothetical protein n=1 Tax=Kitasatospora sp. NPDC006697 TaxID=3364020 RepID=UPI003673FAAF